MEERYSRINSHSGKAHVFDHLNGGVLCNSHFNNPMWGGPNKRKHNATDMLERHSAIPVARVSKGGLNPYKFCCKSCENKLKLLAT